MSINIVPKPSTVQITKFFIVAVRAELFKSATVSVDLFNGTTFVRNELIPLSEDEYSNWVSDDDIVDLVMEKLGFEKAPEPEPTLETVEPTTEQVVEPTEEKNADAPSTEQEETPAVVE